MQTKRFSLESGLLFDRAGYGIEEFSYTVAEAIRTVKQDEPQAQPTDGRALRARIIPVTKNSKRQHLGLAPCCSWLHAPLNLFAGEQYGTTAVSQARGEIVALL